MTCKSGHVNSKLIGARQMLPQRVRGTHTTRRRTPNQPSNNALFAFIGIALFFGGAFAAYSFFKANSQKEDQASKVTVPEKAPENASSKKASASIDVTPLANEAEERKRAIAQRNSLNAEVTPDQPRERIQQQKRDEVVNRELQQAAADFNAKQNEGRAQNALLAQRQKQLDSFNEEIKDGFLKLEEIRRRYSVTKMELSGVNDEVANLWKDKAAADDDARKAEREARELIDRGEKADGPIALRKSFSDRGSEIMGALQKKNRILSVGLKKLDGIRREAVIVIQGIAIAQTNWSGAGGNPRKEPDENAMARDFDLKVFPKQAENFKDADQLQLPSINPFE